QYAVALSSRGTANEQTRPTPHTAQERPHHEMSCVHEKHLAVTGPCGGELRFQRRCQEIGLGGGVLGDGLFWGQRDRGQATPFQTKHFFKKARTCVGRRSRPVSSLMRWHASATVWGGLWRNDASRDSLCASKALGEDLPPWSSRRASRPP